MPRHKTTEIYGNWKMLSPEGELMSRCDVKRARWYLDRNLAEEVGDKEIRLKFVPRGLGNRDVQFLIEDKANQCVVCGIEHHLNRHHVVPYQYRKWFPLQYKSKSSYDVVPICLDDHETYEDRARDLVADLAVEYDAPYNQSLPMSPEDRSLGKMLGYAKALHHHSERIPLERVEKLREEINEYFGHLNLEEILKTPLPKRNTINASHGEKVVAAVLARDELQQFIERWREHFLVTMEPRFLSASWNVKHVHVANLNKKIVPVEDL
jgi:hypothetical protein